MATTIIHYVQNNTAADQSDVNQYADILSGVVGAPGITVNSLTVNGSPVNFPALSIATSSLTGAITASGTTTNNITIAGSSTGTPVTITATGTDTNIGINAIVKGSSNATSVFQVSGSNSANSINLGPASGGNAPFITATGSDTNITLQIHGQGTGSVALTNSLGNFVLQTAGSTASQANYMVVNSAVAASSPGFTAAGSDTNVGIVLNPQGTGTASAITVAGGRLLATGTAPTAAAGANAGTSPPAPVISGNNVRGLVTWGSGTTPAAGAQVVVTFANGGFASAPFVQITEQTSTTAASALGGIYISNIGTTSFTISSVLAPAGSQGNTVYGAYFSITG